MSVTFIIGGARSGKSTFAEQKAKEYAENVLYLATSVVTDQAMADRVKKHQSQRSKSWSTLEMYSNFESLQIQEPFKECTAVLIDCITTLIGNFMVDSKINFDNCNPEEVNKLEKRIVSEVLCLIDVCNRNNKKLIIVSNETGMGVVPSYYMGNYFRDMSGRINREIASKSDFMYFVFSGIPIKLKHRGGMVQWPMDS